MRIRAAVCLYAAFTLAFAVFAGTALAGGGNGHGGGGNNSDHGKSGQSQSGSQQSRHDSSSSSSSSSSSGDNSTGVKPSNSTKHDTHEKASSDKTKQYGNGKTAGQIATQAGYGDSTLHGPGNSQPHKVNCGGHEVDVHALKHKSCGAVQGAKHEQHPTTTQQTTTEQTTTEQTTTEQTTPTPPPARKVTICHKTGSATNPYVEITVSVNALKHGHTVAKGDIIPAPAAGCPTGQVAGTTQTQTTTTTENCTTTQTETTQVVIGVKHFIGPKGSGRFVIIHPNTHSSHFRNKHPDEILYQTVTKTVTVPKADCSNESSSTTTVTTSTEQAQTTSTATTTTTEAAAAASAPAAPSTPAPAGAVLGATAPLNTAAKAKPAGGVLGTTARLGRSVGGTNLPFTGLPLWIFALVAAGLIAVGAVARRAGTER